MKKIHNWFGGGPGGDFKQIVKHNSDIRFVVFGGNQLSRDRWSWVVVKESNWFETCGVSQRLRNRLSHVKGNDQQIHKICLEHGGPNTGTGAGYCIWDGKGREDWGLHNSLTSTFDGPRGPPISVCESPSSWLVIFRNSFEPHELPTELQIHLAKFFKKQKQYCDKRQKEITEYKVEHEKVQKQKKRKLEEDTAEEARKSKRARKAEGSTMYLEEARRLARASGYTEVQHDPRHCVVGFVHHLH